MIDLASEAIMMLVTRDERANAQRANIVHLEKRLHECRNKGYDFAFISFIIGTLFGIGLSCMYFVRPG